MDKVHEDENDIAFKYNNGLDPLSRQYKERYGKPEGSVTPIRMVSMAPKQDPDSTLPRGPVGPPGGTLPNLRPYPAQSAASRLSPRAKGQVGRGPSPHRGNENKPNVEHSPHSKLGSSSNKHASNRNSGVNINSSNSGGGQVLPQSYTGANHTYENAAQLRVMPSPSQHSNTNQRRPPPHEHRFHGSQSRMNDSQSQSPQKENQPPGANIYANMPTNGKETENKYNRLSQPYREMNSPGSYRESDGSRNQSREPSQDRHIAKPASVLAVAAATPTPRTQESTSLLTITNQSFSPGISERLNPYRGINNHVVPELGAPKQDFEALRKQCLSRRVLYEDRDFPPENSSLYYSRHPPYRITWMRPKDIAAQYRLPPQLYVEGASRFDLRQGELGDCWLLAAAACVSEEPALLEEVLPPGQSFHENWYAGMFLFRFWHNAEWREVIVDDRLPTNNGRLIFVHSKPTNEFWGALLEKAYAKLFGSYEALKGGHVADALHDFTGGIVVHYNLKHRDPPLPHNLCTLVARALDQNCLVGCGIDPLGNTDEAVLQNGLVCGHAYSITAMKLIRLPGTGGAVTLVRVRNPWGTSVEWKGSWSDRSREWNAISKHERENMGLVFRKDGEFWMDWREFVTQFHNLDVCYLGPNTVVDTPKAWKMNTFHGRWRRGVSAGGRPSCRDSHWCNPQYRVILTDHDDEDSKCSFIVELEQKDRRKLRHKGMQNVTIGFVIYQLSKTYKLPLPRKFFDRHQFVERCDYFTNARQVTKRFLMEPGEYLIVPSTFEANEAGEFSLRVFFEGENHAMDTDEPSEVVHPEPVKPEPEPSNDEMSAFKQFFYATAGQDMEVDAWELREVINKGLSKDQNHRELHIDACKSMLALVDVNASGKLDFYEFRYLWDMLRSWKKAFYTYDKNNSSYINGYELRQAIAGQGYRLSSRVLGKLMIRFGNQQHHIDLDNFISCMAKILTLFNVFKQQHHDEVCTFTLNQWLEATIAL